MRHVLSALVQNLPGVLSHISGMLASRGYNIDSLAVGETEDPQLSRMTFVVVGDDSVLHQVRKQLEKIVTVVRVDDIGSEDHVERDLMLIKVASPAGRRAEISQLTEIFRGRIVDVAPESMIIEIAGQEGKVEAFIEMMRPFGIIEMARTGRIALVRGRGCPAANGETAKVVSARDYIESNMPAKIYYDKDADLSLLKNKTIAVLGYGSQGHAHAQNLRDSGCNVIVAQNAHSPNGLLATKDGFTPLTIAEATKKADIIVILLPDELQGDIFKASIRDNLSPGNVVLCGHGFNLHYGQFEVPKGVGTLLVAPKGPGHLVRSEFTRGAGVPCLIAMGEGSGKDVFDLGLAYAKGIGGTRAGVIETTIAEETETDLFGEQAVLCGGVSALMKAGFETLVEAGYQPEMAYFECVHEMKLIVDLIYQGGLNYMRYSISNTAEFGDYTRGPRIVTPETKAEMKRILAEIQDGRFAREWLLENRVNAPAFKAMRRRERNHIVEQVGRGLRRLMSWINAKEV